MRAATKETPKLGAPDSFLPYRGPPSRPQRNCHNQRQKEESPDANAQENVRRGEAGDSGAAHGARVGQSINTWSHQPDHC
jgi:hypothetical protein